MSRTRIWKRPWFLGALATLGLAVLITCIVLGIMFPSRAELGWPALPRRRGAHASGGQAVARRLLDDLGSLTFTADPAAPLATLKDYPYLRRSPYLATDRAAASRLFSMAVGEVLLDRDLSRVAHANSIYEGRYALYLPSGDRLTFSAEPGTLLSFGAVGLPAHGSIAACPVTLEVRQGDHVDTIGPLGTSASEFRWRDVEIPVTHARVEIRATAPSSCPGWGHAFLSDPTLWREAAGARPTNLLYINVCTWRADDLGARGATPNLDRLAARAHHFTDARSNANWSKASQISALTGRYPSSLGIKHFRAPVGRLERETFFHAGWPTLASLLRERGYETLALADNVFLAEYLHVGVDLGFARFVDNARHIHNTADLVSEAVRWLDRHGDRPFFIYLNLANPHYRYRPPREYLEQIGFGWSDLTGDLDRALHLGEIAYTDDAIGALLRAVDAMGLRARTLIVIHGDHGETLEPERDLEVEVPDGQRPRTHMIYPSTRFKHGWSWQDTEVRTPLLFAHGDRIRPTRDPRPVGLIDVAPTILAHLGVPKPPTLHGRDLLAGDPTAPILVEGKQFDAVIDEDLKYVRFWPGYGWWRRKATGETSQDAELLYDLAEDPGERTNLVDTRPAEAARLRAALDAISPDPAPLHLLRMSGPAGTTFTGEIEVPGGVRSARFVDQGPDDLLEVGAGRVRFVVRLGPAPVTLAFAGLAPQPPRLRLSDPDLLRVGPHALPLLEADPDGAVAGDLDLLAVGGDQWPEPRQTQAPRVHWWCQRVAKGGPEPWRLQTLEANVMDAMRQWGYAQ